MKKAKKFGTYKVLEKSGTVTKPLTVSGNR